MSSPASPSRPAPALVAVDEALGIMDPQEDAEDGIRAGASLSSSAGAGGGVVGASHHADG